MTRPTDTAHPSPSWRPLYTARELRAHVAKLADEAWRRHVRGVPGFAEAVRRAGAFAGRSKP